MTTPANDFPIETDVASVKRMLDEQHDFLLLDCREQEEHDIVRIARSTLLPMSEIQARVSELQPHRDTHIVVHCHHGGRSMQVTQWLRSQGFARVQNMAGGIDQWAVEIDSTLPRY